MELCGTKMIWALWQCSCEWHEHVPTGTKSGAALPFQHFRPLLWPSFHDDRNFTQFQRCFIDHSEAFFTLHETNPSISPQNGNSRRMLLISGFCKVDPTESLHGSSLGKTELFFFVFLFLIDLKNSFLREVPRYLQLDTSLHPRHAHGMSAFPGYWWQMW